MRQFGFVVMLVGSLTASVAAQEAVTIKVARPKAGDRIKVAAEEKTVTKSAIVIMGMEQSKDVQTTKSFAYTDDVIEIPADARRPTKLKRTYEKAQIGTDGNSKTLSIEGKTVLIEKTDGKYSFTVDGEAVTGEAAKLLDDEFSKTRKSDPDAVMLPTKPVKPGDTWKIDPTTLADSLAEGNGPRIDPAKVTATGKLLKAYMKDGRQFGAIEITVEAPIISLGEKSPFELKDGKMVVTMNGDGVIDGSAPTGITKTSMQFGVSGSGKGFDLKVEAKSTQDRKQELLPKK